jgi:serine/threonine protein kinase
MPVAEAHPSELELAAFTLGTLDDEAQASIETHVAACSSCQERAAVAPGDSLVELLRRVDARPAALKDTVTEAGEHAVTPDTLPPTEAERPMPVPPEPVEVPPELVDHPRYRVRRLIGVGGMGAVYEAEHLVMDRPVAIKVINRAFTANAAAVERFRREVRAAARLSHPHIVTAHDAEQTGDALFLVTEYVHGISLGRLVRERGPLPIAEACDYIRQAALGLQHAHERGMVHRDIKPDNLIVSGGVVSGGVVSGGVVSDDKTTADKPTPRSESLTTNDSPLTTPPLTTHHSTTHQIKVLDFGLAVLAVERRNGLTAEDAIVGTPDYMAPEQAEDSHAADIRSDIYSLGCSLYVLLTGNVPYPAETPLLRILAHRDRPLPSLRTLRPDAPPELAGVLARMMAKKPRDRYQTPGEVTAALAPFVGHVSNVPPEKARWKRAPRYLLAASLLAALLLAGGVVYRIQTDKGELVIKTESDDVEVVIKQSGEQIDIIDTKTKKSIRLRSGEYDLELKDAPGLKLDLEKATLKRGKETVATIERITTSRLSTSGAPQDVEELAPLHRIQFSEGRQFGTIDISPDGRYFLATRFDPYKLRIWEVKTGKLVRELPESVAHFTPDSRKVIATWWNELHVYDIETGECIRKFDAGAQVHEFRLSVTGTRIAIALPESVKVFDWSIGKQLCQIPKADGITLLLSPDGRRLHGQRGGKGIIAWDTDTGKQIDAYPQLKMVPGFRSISRNGERLLCLDGANLRVFAVPSGKEIRSLDLDLIGGVVFYDADLLLARSSIGNSVRVWDLVPYKLRARLRFSEALEDRLQFGVSHDGKYAAFGNRDMIYVFRLPDLPDTKDKP